MSIVAELALPVFILIHTPMNNVRLMDDHDIFLTVPYYVLHGKFVVILVDGGINVSLRRQIFNCGAHVMFPIGPCQEMH